jgi:hypothetical protein
MKRLIGLLALLLGLGLASAAAAAPSCAPEGKVAYLCGLMNVEDMVLAPDGRQILASGMTSPTVPVGHLYVIDAKARTFRAVRPFVGAPALAAYRDCPGPPDLARFAPHGLGIRRDSTDSSTVYVVNHGGRQAIEVFRWSTGEDHAGLRWIGCAVLPDNGSGNGVAPLPDGGFVASKFEDAGDSGAFGKMADKAPTGAVYAWAPGKGWRKLAHSEMSGANGVEVTPDGRYILVNAWPEQKVYRFRVGSEEPPVSVDVPFLPDNLRGLPDGHVLVAGQDGDIKRLLAPCGKPRCVAGWWVAHLNPETMKVRVLLHMPATDEYGDATSALRVGDELWIGTYWGDRVAIVPKP